MVEDLIQNGDYQEALSYLTDINDEKTRYLRLVCLIGLKQYEQAKEEGMYAKAHAKDTYYDVISMYVTALKELQEFEEAIDILIEELSMPYIPYEYENVFNAAYDQILLDKQEARYEVESKNQIFSIEEIEQLLKNKSSNDELIYMALDQLQQLNIRLILPTIRDYLNDPKRDFFIKSLLLEILIDQQVDDEFEVEKFNQYYDINPVYMPLVLEQDAYQGIGLYLEKNIEDENPSLYQQCLDYLEYYLYSVYPNEIYEDDYHIIAASIHYYVATLQMIDIDEEDIEIMYYCTMDDIERMKLNFNRIDVL
ncbi:MAG: hypothetical protein LUG60_03365 [Erysipelotrichaceae bacterium]|nr:hypothetical protein [Erysipelotrichaceae bacterium]